MFLLVLTLKAGEKKTLQRPEALHLLPMQW
jgi:hypothetical protein